MGFLRKLFGRDRGCAAPPVAVVRGEPRDVELWEGAASIRVPADLALAAEEDGTLVLTPPGDHPPVVLRLSLITFASKSPGPHKGYEFVQQKAAEQGVAFEELNGLGVMSYDEPAEADGEPLLLRYWHLGANDEIVIASATITERRRAEPDVSRVLDQMRAILDSLRLNSRYEFVETGQGTVMAKVSTLSHPPEQDVRPFGAAELRWLEDSIASGRKLLEIYGTGTAASDEADLLRTLDLAFARWAGDEAPSRPPAEQAADGFGALFGQHLVESYGMRWVTVSDDAGTDVAVQARPPADESMIAFPVDAVLKRIESGQTGFFWEIGQVVRSRLECSGEADEE